MLLRNVVRCWECISSYSFLKNEEEADRAAKRTLLPATLVGSLLFISAVFAESVHTFGGVVVVAGSSTLVLVVLARFVAGKLWAEVCTVVWLVVIVAQDAQRAAVVMDRFWPTVVLLTDTALVANVRQSVICVVLVCTLVCTAAVAAERVAVLGVFEAVRDGDKVAVCDCADPPCSQSVASAADEYVSLAVMLLIDYYLTRRFAVAMREQMAVVSASITTCDELTRRLARYEVDAATEVLCGGSGSQLPSELRESYRRLLDNLNSYLPYIPDSLLLADDADGAVCRNDSDCSSEATVDGVAPGAGQEEADVCIVFTDIQCSTALWEEHYQGMYAGLLQHNAVIRRAAAAHGGYEVKTIGDAFMLAFSLPAPAVQFALAVQQQLMEAEWPAELLQSPLCCRMERPGGGLLWKGLRVRAGIHCGTARVETNPVTHRSDYFGPVVNTAARIEAEVRHGGLIGVSDELLSRVGAASMRQLGAVVIPLGARVMRGVSTATPVSVLLPQELQQRCGVLSDSTPSVSAAAAPAQQRDSIVTTSTDGGGRNNNHSSSGSSNSSFCRSDDRPTEVNTRLALHLRRSVASCAAVTTALEGNAGAGVRALLSAVERAADVSQGVVQSVLSSSCVVTWNAPRSCAGHPEQCTHFLAVVRQLCDASDTFSWSGAASGTALSGNVAGRRRRFATVIGGCVELARVLSAVAERQQMCTLAAGLVAARRNTRCIGHLQMASGQSVAVFNVAVEQHPNSSLDDPVGEADAESDVMIDHPVLPHLWGLEATAGQTGFSVSDRPLLPM